MSEINDLMDELLDYEMDEDYHDEELDNEILQLNHDKYSNVVENVPKIELKELTFSQNTLPMDVKEDSSSNEEKQKSDKSTSSLASSEKLESVEQVTTLFPSNFHNSNEFWKKSYATLTKVLNHRVETPIRVLAQAEKVEDSSSIYVETRALNELSIADDVSSLTINESNNDLKEIGIGLVDSNVNEQKPSQNAFQHNTSMLMNLNKQKSPPYVNQNTNVNNQMPPQYENLHTTVIPMKINNQKPEQKPLQVESQNTSNSTIKQIEKWSSGENSKKTASRRHRNSKGKRPTNSQGLETKGTEPKRNQNYETVFHTKHDVPSLMSIQVLPSIESESSQGPETKGMEPKRDQNYETVFHTKRDVPSLMSIKVLPSIESEGQTRRVVNNSNNLTTTASPFIITALNGPQSSRKVQINPYFRGFAVKAYPKNANVVPIRRTDKSVDVRESMKRNLRDEDLRHKMCKKHRPIIYEANNSEVIQANGCANGLKDDSESDEYRMKIEKLKLIREEFQRKKEFRRQQVGVDAYNEDLCRI